MVKLSFLSSLIKAARNEIPADLLIKNCQVVNVFNGLIESYSVAVFGGIVVGFGEHEARETIDLDGQYLVPGFIDGHIHIESSMVTPVEFSRAVAPHGTSAVVADPHEIANVLGVDGIEYLLETSANLPVDFYFMVPSCVPATHLETSGASIGIPEMQELMGRERILGLAEMMNYPGVINGFPEVLEKLELFKGKIIDGHAPSVSGNDLDAYLVAGIGSDHECVDAYEAEEKLSKGMWIMIREGSQSKNLAALASVVNRVTARRCMLVSDDRHPDDLLVQGHMDVVVNRAIEEGIDPVTAIQMVTIN
ncbi:MAG TPA: adenine deaminase, partial [Deltaproteobacteria bacterium]|nr:adenine deaminase [Deltaproteobacteria bacterium]